MAKFYKWMKEYKERIFMVILAVVIASVFGIIQASFVDWYPATIDEWNYLYEQLKELEEQGIKAIYDMEDVMITANQRVLKIESEQCMLVFEMEDDDTFSVIEKQDKAKLGIEGFKTGSRIVSMSFLLGLVSLVFMNIAFEEATKHKNEKELLKQEKEL